MWTFKVKKISRSKNKKEPFRSVQCSHSVVSDSVTPWTAAHQASCPSSTPRVSPNPCPSSRWCHPTISSFVIPFSSCLQSFPASGSFEMSQLVTLGGQSIGVSASTSVLPMNTQDWSPLGWTGWISLQSKGLLRVFSNTTVQKHQFFSAQLSSPFNSHPYMTSGKIIALARRTFVGKVMSLLFCVLSRLVITCLPWSKHLLISWLQSPSTVILEPQKIKSLTVSLVSPSICHDGWIRKYGHWPYTEPLWGKLPTLSHGAGLGVRSGEKKLQRLVWIIRVPSLLPPLHLLPP